MANWLDLTKIIPGLEKGQWLHVVNTPLNPLVDSLSENGFSVIVIDGSQVVFLIILGKIGLRGMIA